MMTPPDVPLSFKSEEEKCFDMVLTLMAAPDGLWYKKRENKCLSRTQFVFFMNQLETIEKEKHLFHTDFPNDKDPSD